MGAVELFYRDEGSPSAPPVLLVGSLGSSLSMWEPIVPELCRRFRVIRCDIRGHGASPAPAGPYTMAELGGDLLALLDRLALPRVHMAGVSLGGMMGIWLAAHAPERVESLALVCTSARLAPKSSWYERATLVRAHGAQAVADKVVARWVTPEFATQRSELVQALQADVAATPREGYASCCEAIAEWDGLDLLAQIKVPTLVIGGERDAAISPVHSQLIGQAVPAAHVTTIDAAHLPIVERPAEVLRLLLAHLGERQLDETQGDLARQREQGERIRRAVLGDAHVDRAHTNRSTFTEPFQEFVTQVPWGMLWARPGLTRSERSIVTLTTLAILHHDEELGMHVKAALRNGLSVRQIQEVLLHVAVYAGVPVANRAFAVAQRALAEAGVQEALERPAGDVAEREAVSEEPDLAAARDKSR